MKSQLLKRKTKCQLYKIIVLPAVSDGSESWTLSEAHEALLGGSDRKILKRIYGAVQIDGAWRRSYSKELYKESCPCTELIKHYPMKAYRGVDV
jgi:hypothetical protein